MVPVKPEPKPKQPDQDNIDVVDPVEDDDDSKLSVLRVYISKKIIFNILKNFSERNFR